MPALLTRMSRPPNFDSKKAASASTSDSLMTSSFIPCASTPSAFNLSAAAFAFASSLAPKTTVTPCCPSWRAISKPSPLFAPVINATLFLFISAPSLAGPLRFPLVLECSDALARVLRHRQQADLPFAERDRLFERHRAHCLHRVKAAPQRGGPG